VPPSAKRPGNPNPISVVTLCALTMTFAARGFAGWGPRMDQPSTLSPLTYVRTPPWRGRPSPVGYGSYGESGAFADAISTMAFPASVAPSAIIRVSSSSLS
jgi:hypothetical protein